MMGGCANNPCSTNAQEVSSNKNQDGFSYNYRWLRDLGIYADGLKFSDSIPNPSSRKGVYLDSLQIQELIPNKYPRRQPLPYSIRLSSLKELSDSICLCIYVYEYSDMEYAYMITYNTSKSIDVLKLPNLDNADIVNVIDDIEYIDYFESSVRFTDNSHFIITELSSTRGWNNDEECVFNTSFKKETFYSISIDGQIHKEDVIKTQSCPG